MWHIMKLNLYVLTLCPLLYCDDIITVPLDPISYNSIYLNSIYPVYQPDFLNGEHILDGSISTPLSIYFVEDLYINLNDSIRTNTSLLYNQGDVGYRKLAIDIKTRIGEKGIVKLLANGTTYPGKASQFSDDNILQNYLFHFSKKYNFSAVSFYIGYHLQNKELQYINSNSGEVYLSGINYNVFGNKYEVELDYAYQIGWTNYEKLYNYYIVWGLLKSKYYITENIHTYIENVYKKFHCIYDMNSNGANTYLNKLKFGVVLKNNFFDTNIAASTLMSNLINQDNNSSIVTPVHA